MRLGLIAGVAMLAVTTPALAEKWDFVLVNKTGRTITQVEVAPTGSGEWVQQKVEEDVAVGEVKPGKDHTVHFEKAESACRFDVRLTFSDKSTATATGLDVCDYAFAEFAFKGELLTVRGS